MKRRSFVAWCLGTVPFLKESVGGECECCEDVGKVKITGVELPNFASAPTNRKVTIHATVTGPDKYLFGGKVCEGEAVEVSPGKYDIEIPAEHLGCRSGWIDVFWGDEVYDSCFRNWKEARR